MINTEREFFQKIREAIFINPFDRARLELDLAATGLHATTGTDEILANLVHRVGKAIDSVQDRSSQQNLNQDDRSLLRFAMLFHTFHLYCDDIDEHIAQQQLQVDVHCSPSWTSPFLKKLYDYGFQATESRRFLELSFQLRRAFFFINKIKGSSSSVMNLRRVLWNNVFTEDIQLYEKFLWNRMEDFSTMILGETGTGKGMAAAAIGRSGYIPYDERKKIFKENFARTFISINLSQYPEQLIESELFGHKKGAFTGAVEAHKGVFSRCSPHGSIFLDEIGDVSPHVQIKLLRVLQERQFFPVGSHKPEKFQGRVIGATNQSLESARQSGQFRDDFYYRLCSDVIHVPPLRQRLLENRGEIKELLQITVKRILGHPAKEIVLIIHNHIRKNQPEKYHWPGNIRELEQCVRRILLKGSYDWYKPAVLSDKNDRFIAGLLEGNHTVTELLSYYCSLHYSRLGTYEAVAKVTGLDRRTVKKYITPDEDDR